MKSPALLADAAGMDSDTLTAPPPADMTDWDQPDLSSPSEGAAETADESADQELVREEVNAVVSSGRPAEPVREQKIDPALIAAEKKALSSSEPPPDAELSPQRNVFLTVLSLPFRILVGIMVLLDLPFAFMGSRLKAVVGCLAVSTAMLAAVVWVYGPQLVQHLPRTVQSAQSLAGGPSSAHAAGPSSKHEAKAPSKHRAAESGGH